MKTNVKNVQLAILFFYYYYFIVFVAATNTAAVVVFECFEKVASYVIRPKTKTLYSYV